MSPLQQPFLDEIAKAFCATQLRIMKRLADTPLDASNVIEDELRGLYHGLCVILDGGTALADKGLVYLADEDGNHFDRSLHETCFNFWPVEAK